MEPDPREQKRNRNSPSSRRHGSLGSEMESKTATRSMLASFLTFQFLCKSRSSHGSFFASFNKFSSSETVLVLIVKLERVLQPSETAIVVTFVSVESGVAAESSELVEGEAKRRRRKTSGGGKETDRQWGGGGWCGGEWRSERRGAGEEERRTRCTISFH
ncbi:hypothetical protein U1Q18_032552 [Sarracenia purpurea var. burkii]